MTSSIKYVSAKRVIKEWDLDTAEIRQLIREGLRLFRVEEIEEGKHRKTEKWEPIPIIWGDDDTFHMFSKGVVYSERRLASSYKVSRRPIEDLHSDEVETVFLLEKVKEIERKYPRLEVISTRWEKSPGDDNEATGHRVEDIAISKDKALRWEDITATFLSDTELHFQYGENSVTRTYDKAGFSDGRTGLPRVSWKTLLLVAGSNSSLPWTFDNRRYVEKRVAELRRHFRNLFPNIDGDPFPIDREARIYTLKVALKAPPRKDPC